MAPPSLRVDALAVRLIERLEARRKTWRGSPEVAFARLEGVGRDQVDQLVSELDELGAGERYADSARRALLEDFLPRYLRLALEQNALEEAGWRTWRGGDPVARLAGGAGALVLALVLMRFVRSPVVLIAFAAAFVVPFLPEIRSIWYRWQYQRALQGVVNDVSRLQAELDEVDEVDLEAELAGRDSRPSLQTSHPPSEDESTEASPPRRPRPEGERS